jgi:MSHA pilin protein MshC
MEKKSGFTLIELIVVIVIMTIISAYAVARWPGVNINLNAQAQQLANQIRYTQSQAFANNIQYRINLTSTSYSITDINGNAVIDPVTGANTTSMSSGITASFANLPNNLIAFDANGIPYTNSTATTVLASVAVITLSQGGVSRTVSISPQTGRVIVQ